MKVLFIHRSVGENLIRDGHIYDILQAHESIDFADYNNNTGILRETGGTRRLNLVFPNNNTAPADYAQVFRHDAKDKYKAARDFAMQYDVVILKSCYPNSNLKNNEQVSKVEDEYRSIVQFFRTTTRRLILLTSPPLVPIRTDCSSAARARYLSERMVNDLPGATVRVFNLFNFLAEHENSKQANMLKKPYRRFNPLDSHPNAAASQTIAPFFVDSITQ